MRAAYGLALLAVAATISGCGQSEAQVRDELRAQMMQRCSRDIAPNTAALPGFDSNGYCRCVTDKAMGERNLAELKELFDDRARLTAAGRQAATECLAQQSLDGTATPAPASDTETESDAAPAPASEKERERPRAPAAAPAPRSRPEEPRDAPQPGPAPVVPPAVAPPPRPATVPSTTPPPEPAVRDEKAGPRG